MPHDRGSATNLCDFRQVAGSYTVYLPGYDNEMNLLIQNVGSVGVNKS